MDKFSYLRGLINLISPAGRKKKICPYEITKYCKLKPESLNMNDLPKNLQYLLASHMFPDQVEHLAPELEFIEEDINIIFWLMNDSTTIEFTQEEVCELVSYLTKRMIQKITETPLVVIENIDLNIAQIKQTIQFLLDCIQDQSYGQVLIHKLMHILASNTININWKYGNFITKELGKFDSKLFSQTMKDFMKTLYKIYDSDPDPDSDNDLPSLDIDQSDRKIDVATFDQNSIDTSVYSTDSDHVTIHKNINDISDITDDVLDDHVINVLNDDD